MAIATHVVALEQSDWLSLTLHVQLESLHITFWHRWLMKYVHVHDTYQHWQTVHSGVSGM